MASLRRARSQIRGEPDEYAAGGVGGGGGGTSVNIVDPMIAKLPLDGVNLKFLKRLLSFSAKFDPDYELTVAEILEKIVIPTTIQSKKSLARYLKAEYFEEVEPRLAVSYSQNCVKEADVYVIYARSLSFYDFINCLECYAENNLKEGELKKNKNDVYFWIDIFSANQFIDISPDLLTSINYKIIGKIRSTCIVMLPFDGAEVLSRSWCLYELFVASLHKKKLNFLFLKSKYIQFEKSIFNSFEFLKNACCTRVMIESSECYSDPERAIIIAALQDMHVDGIKGVDESINQYIIDQFYDRSIASIKSYLKRLGTEILDIQNRYSSNSVCLNVFVVGDGRDETNLNTVPLQLQETTALLTLAVVYFQRGDLENATTTYVGLLETHNHIINVDHPSIGSVYNNLGILYKRLGDFGNSKHYYKKALRLKKALYGKHHESYIATCINLAMLNKALGKLSDALALLLQVYSDMENIYGEKSRESIKVVELVIEIHIELNKLDDAISFLKLCLEIHLIHSGAKHVDTINIYESLGVFVARAGDINGGVAILEQTLESRIELFGENHQSVIDSLCRLAVMKQQLRKMTESLVLFTRVYNCISSHTAFDNQGRFCMESLGDINAERMNFDGAIFFYEKAFESSRKELGAHEDTYRISYKLGDTYISAEKYDQCEPLFKFSFEGRHKLLGDTHPSTLESQFALANSLVIQFKYQEARITYSYLLRTFESIYGPDSSHAIDALDALAVVYTKLGQVQAAKETYARIIKHYDVDASGGNDPNRSRDAALHYTKLLNNIFDGT